MVYQSRLPDQEVGAIDQLPTLEHRLGMLVHLQEVQRAGLRLRREGAFLQGKGEHGQQVAVSLA
ncbi:hypothetical protein SDC9_89618 [bioreactor metagenome]|uniref:Uncharacterized protein n=1 Tax=bioreactor metagenome TaxID=1076179 RepID=A0A644ZQB2_9ZZZZ